MYRGYNKIAAPEETGSREKFRVTRKARVILLNCFFFIAAEIFANSALEFQVANDKRIYTLRVL